MNQNAICQTQREGAESFASVSANTGLLKKALPRIAPGPRAKNVQIKVNDHFAVCNAGAPLTRRGRSASASCNRSRCARPAPAAVKMETSRHAATLKVSPQAAEWMVNGQRPQGISSDNTAAVIKPGGSVKMTKR